MRRAIVFDGDDTLWNTEPLYDNARQKARKIVEATGLDGGAWEELERRRDVENVKRFGHKLERFPTSCAEAYELLASDTGHVPDPAVAMAIRDAARTAFEEAAPLATHAREALAELKSRGFLLALLTKGDPTLQRQRLEQSGLEGYFDAIDIVEEKTAQSIVSLLDRLGVKADAALSVGNSIPSDVLPSLAAGVQPIWIDAHVWEYERTEVAVDDRVIEVDDLFGVLRVAS